MRHPALQGRLASLPALLQLTSRILPNLANMKKYRNNGAIGAILDEYEKSIQELKEVIAHIASKDLMAVVDDQTPDENCRSVQTILSHVVAAGYNYVIAIRKWLGEEVDYVGKELLASAAGYQKALDEMFRYNVKFFDDYPGIAMHEFDNDKKIKVRWGQSYDVEQLFEHAIVHVLRHRRQIERFIIKLSKREAGV